VFSVYTGTRTGTIVTVRFRLCLNVLVRKVFILRELAERVGFEPTVPLTGHNGFRDREAGNRYARKPADSLEFPPIIQVYRTLEANKVTISAGTKTGT
jgi:hypothetical protein